MQTGYREGLDEGKELTLQHGFNAGAWDDTLRQVSVVACVPVASRTAAATAAAVLLEKHCIAVAAVSSLHA
jgi:hypothetical protein